MDFSQAPGVPYTRPAPMNPPPQIFGSYGPDGSPLINSMNQPIFDDDLLLGPDLNEPEQSKRRRIARACDMCRKKKIKCDGKQPCAHCTNYKTECVFTHVEKKRQPPKGAKYIEGLENRLARMESLLRLSGALSEEDGGADLGTLEKRLADRREANGNHDNYPTPVDGEEETPGSAHTRKESTAGGDRAGSNEPNGSAGGSSMTSPVSQTANKEEKKENEEEVAALSDMMCSLLTNNCGETRYIGSSSGFSIFSPKGIQWVSEKTGDNTFQDMIQSATTEANRWVHWKPEVFGDIFLRRTFKQLPPKAEALSLLKDYFENFNCMFPLFHEPTFMHLVHKHYSREPLEGAGWWASLNVALAIAHRLRVMSNLVPQEEDQKGWGYLKNALAVQTELTMRSCDLLSVQALLGMALFLQGTPNPQPSFFLVAAAMRIAHSIGLHKRGSGFKLNAVESEQRKRVFWIAYMLDRDICLRSGRPPIQDDDDMNVELPSEDPDDNVGNIPLADGKGKVNLFRLMCTFAIIESKVYKQLYSVKASKQSDGELLNTIGELDKELEDWKDAIPLDFRPEHEIKASHTPLILHVVVLHFAYYNCLTTIHRMSVHHGYWTSRLSNFAIQGLNARPLNPRVFSSAALCVQAARASIHLIKYIPQGDYACVWLILYYPVSALVTLFANILQNPQDTRARSDLKLMNLVVSFLSTLVTDESQTTGVKRMLKVCSEFERVARVVLDKSDNENTNRRKRKQQQEAALRQQELENRDIEDAIARSEKAVASQQNRPQSRNDPNLGSHGASPTQSNGTPASSHLYPGSADSKPLTPNEGGQFTFTSPNMGNQVNHNHSSHSRHSSSHLNSHQSPQHWYAEAGSPPLSGDRQPGSAGLPPTTSPGFPSFDMSTLAAQQTRLSNAVTSGMPMDNVSLGGLADIGMQDSFQQPFVPQDLWQMPMTLEWDWADISTAAGVPDMNGINGMNGAHVPGLTPGELGSDLTSSGVPTPGSGSVPATGSGSRHDE